MEEFAKRVAYGAIISEDEEKAKKFGTILIDQYGSNMEDSFDEHETLAEAQTDAIERSELYRKLFSRNLNVICEDIKLLEE